MRPKSNIKKTKERSSKVVPHPAAPQVPPSARDSSGAEEKRFARKARAVRKLSRSRQNL